MAIAAGLLAAALPVVDADASTVASFTWVDTAGTGGGSLTLTLPGTLTSDTFSVGGLSASAAFADLTAFSYKFSDGLSIGLSNLTSHIFTNSSGTAITTNTVAWATSNQSHAGFGNGTYDLITGFNFSGAQTVGTGGLSNYKISEALFSAGNVGQGSNQITPTVGSASNDAGYWKLSSLTTTAVPLPAALPLMLSGMTLLAAVRRRRPDRSRSPSCEASSRS